MALQADITAAHQWYTNEDKRFDFAIKQSDGTTAQNITGFAISWIVKRRKTDVDSAAILTKTTANGGIVLSQPLTGLCTVTVADTDTLAVPPGLYHHELKRTDETLETVLSFGTAVLQRSLHKS